MRDPRRYFCHQIVLLRGPTGDEGVGTDAYGEPLSAGTPVGLTLNARVEWDNRRVVTQGGEEVVCAGVVYLASKYTDPAGVEQELDIGPQDRIVFEGREHPVATRNRAEGWGWQSDRASHWEVWIR